MAVGIRGLWMSRLWANFPFARALLPWSYSARVSWYFADWSNWIPICLFRTMNTASRREFCFLALVWMRFLAWVCSGSVSSQVELFSKEQMLPAHIALFSRVSGMAHWGCGPTSVLVTLQISLSVRHRHPSPGSCHLLCRNDHLLKLFFLKRKGRAHTLHT